MLALLRKLFCCCQKPAADGECKNCKCDCCKKKQPTDLAAIAQWEPAAFVTILDKDVGKKGQEDAIPAAVLKQYQKVIPGDVTIRDQGVCVTSDVAVLGNVEISAGGTCITGNVLVFGDVTIDGTDGKNVNGTCITGHAIVLGNVKIRGNVCVTSNVFVKGDVHIEGTLKVDGKLCQWGSRNIQPLL